MTAPLRVLIADDEPSARRRLLGFLAQEADVAVVAECGDGLSACAAIAGSAPGLVFLDVEMPGMSGLDVVRQTGVERMPVTIFATAYDHYATAAFDANIIDYLLKPYDQPRFSQAMAKARTALQAGAQAHYRQRLDSALRAATAPAGHLLVRVGDNLQVVRTADIRYICAEGNYVRLHTVAGQFQLRERMMGMIERLDPAKFRRIHRSRIVNLDHVDKLLPWFAGDYLVLLDDGTRLALSRTYRGELRDLL
jgi:two-component system LytT family response regulator